MTRLVIAPLALAAACLFTGAAEAAKAVRYRLVDLGSEFSSASINDKDLLAGQFMAQAAVMNRKGHVTPLGSLGDSSRLLALNDKGQGAGNWYGDFQPRAMLYADGRLQDLDALTMSPGMRSEAHGINHVGQVAGSATTAAFASYAFLYDQGQVKSLGSLPGYASSYALGLNDAGHVVGYVSNGVSWLPFLYRDGQMTDLGVGPAGFCQAFAINNDDQVVGECAADSFTWIAFLKTGTQTTYLGVARPTDEQSQAFAVNSQGTVVGKSQDSTSSVAFVYDGKTTTDLNTLLVDDGLGWKLLSADSINDQGVILAFGQLGSSSREVALVPVKKN